MPVWLQREWCSSFVLALGHFVWQGTLIAVVLAIALRATKSVAARYWMSLSALLLMAACPVVTLGWLVQPAQKMETSAGVSIIRDEPSPSQPVISDTPFDEATDVGHVANVPMPPPAAALDFNATGVMPPPAPVDERSWWQRFAPQLTSLYLSGVALMWLRLAVGLWGGRRLRRQASPVTDGSLLGALERQADALGLKLRPVLAFCERVTVPTVVGILKPMILLPLSLANGLSPEQIESVLAHELAHLRRYDHLVNLLQRVIESLLFAHPAVWWVSHRIREEREHCCDDLVVACGAMPLDYAKSLLRVAELSQMSRIRRSVSAVSLLATGDKPSNLRQRIARLLGESATPSLRLSPRVLLLSICIPLIAVIATIQSGASNPQSLPPDKDEQPQVTKSSAMLPNGVTVTLVGVGFHPSEKRDWWQANGSPMDKRPYDKFAGSPLYQDESRLVDCREFALEIQGLPQDHFVMTRIDPQRAGISIVLNKMQDGVFFTEMAAGKFSDDKTTSLVVGLSVDPLEPVQGIGPDGRKLVAVDVPPDVKLLYDLIQPVRVQSRDGGTELVCGPLGDLNQKANWVLVAIDIDGKRTNSTSRSTSSNDRENSFHFKLPRDRLARFEYRLRPLRHWVTFENVSVQPGKLTDVKVIVEFVAQADEDRARKTAKEIEAIGDPKPLWCQPIVAPKNTWPNEIWPLLLDNRRVLIGENILDVRTGESLGRLAFDDVSLSLLRVSANRRYLLVCGTFPKSFEGNWLWPTTLAQVWDLATLKQVGKTLQVGRLFSGDCDADVSPDGKVVVAGNGGGVVLWNVETGEKINTAAVEPRRIDAVGYSPDGQWLVISDRNDLTYWKWRTGEKPQTIEVGRRIISLAFSPDSRYLAEGPDSRGDIEIRDLQTLKIVHTLRDEFGSPLFVDKMCFSNDGKTLIASNDVGVDETKLLIPHRLLSWDLPSGRLKAKGSRPGQYGWGIDATPNGFYVVRANESNGLMAATWVLADNKDDAASATVPRADLNWGPAINGLRASVAPVLSSMSEDAIDPAQRVTMFEKHEDVAFVVELENVSDKPIKLLNTRYGDSYGEAKGKANSDWFGQFLFSIDLFDESGKLIERPDVQVVDLNMALDGTQIATVESGKTHRFLLRPAKWLSPFKLPLDAGHFRAVVRYHGLPERVATRMKEYRPDYRPDSPVLAAVSGDITAPAATFAVRTFSGRSKRSVVKRDVVEPKPDEGNDQSQAASAMPFDELVWGQPVNGLRAAMSFEPSKAAHTHSEKPIVRLHLQNVGTQPLNLIADLDLPAASATIENDQGEPVDLDDQAGGLLSPRLRGLLTLKPQQVVVLDWGYIGLAITEERANQFDDGTLRRLIAPAGKYSMELEISFRNVLNQRRFDGQDNVLVKDAWVGKLKTGAAPLTITNEIIECDIVDAVTGKPVAKTTTSFKFIKPKLGDVEETTVSHMIWGPESPSRIYFTIPDEVMRRADREELEVQWGTGNHPDYEDFSPAERIKLKQFFNEGTKAARDTLRTIKLTPKKKTAETAPPKGLEFLKPYPKLHGLSLDMTEPQFLEIVKQQEVKTRNRVDDGKVTHDIGLGDGHTLIVMFDKDAKCSGIQRVRGEDSSGGPPELRTMREPSFRLPGHSNITGIGFDNNSTDLVAVSTYHFATIRRWDLVGMKLKSDIMLSSDRHLRPFRQGSFKLSGDGRRVIAATDDFVGIWETATGKLLTKLPIPKVDANDTIHLLDCTPDLSVIVGSLGTKYSRTTLVYDAHTVVWDGNSGKMLRTLTHKNQNHFFAMSLSFDGKRLATTNGGVRVWDTSAGQQLLSVPNDNKGRKHSDPEVSNEATFNVWCVQFSPDGTQVAMGDMLGVKLLDVASGKLLQQLERPHRYGLGTLVFSKDGRLLARTGTGDRAEGNKTSYVVPIWSTQTGEKLFELHTESGAGAFSDDNKQFAVGVSDWEMALAVFQLSGSAANTTQLAPESTKDKVAVGTHCRGKEAEEFIDNWKPVWGEPQLGIRYGIALTTPQRQFRVGERVPLVVFFRNASNKPLQIDTRPDFFGNTPKVVDAKGVTVGFEKIPLLGGSTSRYVENLEPGEAVGPLYLNFGLGENPRPGQQNWTPYWKTPVAGKYKLTHSVSIKVAGPEAKPDAASNEWKSSDWATGTIEFEIADVGKAENKKEEPPEPNAVRERPSPLEFRVVVNPADGDADPRVPADFLKRHYPDNTPAGRAAAKDRGFIWIPVAKPRDGGVILPVEASRGEVRHALLGDTTDTAFLLDGERRIVKCDAVPDQNQPDQRSIQVTLDEPAGAALRRLTEAHLNQKLAVVVEGKIIAAPTIRSVVGTDVMITGNFSRDEADKLVAAILSRNEPDDKPKPTGEGGKTENKKEESQKPNAGAELSGRLYVNAGLRTAKDETRFSQSAIAIDPNTGNWTRLQNLNESGFTVPLSHIRVSPDGRTMLFMREKELWKCDALTGDRAERVLEKGSPAAWSPDGKTFIAVVETNERDAQFVENWIVNTDGQKQSVLAIPKGDAVEDWSADGQWVVVRSRLDSQIYLVKPDGSGRRRLADSIEYSLGHSSFSPDSRRIVYLSRQTLDDKSRFSLRTINIDGTGDREILGEKKAGSEPDSALWTAPMAARWSPDGKHLAVVLFDHTRDGGILAINGNWRLAMIDADGGNLRELKLEGMLTTVLPWDGPEWRPIAPAMVTREPKQGAKLKPATEQKLKWGEPANGLRMALAWPPSLGEPGMGDAQEFYLVVQNVSQAAVRLTANDAAPNPRRLTLQDETPVSRTLDEVPIPGDWRLQPREAAFVRLFHSDEKLKDGRTLSAVKEQIVRVQPQYSFTAEMSIQKAPAGAWTGTLVTEATRGSADVIPPQNKDPEALDNTQADKAATETSQQGVQAIPPLLEFRFAAQPADSKFEPRVPADFEKRRYSGNSVIGRMVAKDKGFVWVGVAASKDRNSSLLPVERLLVGNVREALLADTPEHSLPFNNKWAIEDCRVVPDPNAADRFAIELKLNEAGGAVLRTLTKSHLNQPLAILVNNEIIAAPIVRSEIGRDIAITGNFTREQADKLVVALSVRPQAASGIEKKFGTLSGRFVYDGESPAQADLLSSFAKIDVSQPQQPGSDGRFSGIEAVYRDFLKHRIRPKTEDASLLVSKDGGIANVVVWVVNKDIPWTAPQGGFPPAMIRLKDGNFSPRLAAVSVGQPLLIENHDPVSLNFAAEFSRALNPSMNVILPPGTENTPQRMSFRAPEPYPATYRSNLAPWANGWVFVHGNPFVAVSQPDGSFTLPNLPTGDWEFQVWHERGGFLQHWPKGRFQQSIKPGDNKLGTIKLKPEHLGQKPAQAIATIPPPKNREQIGEVLGKPVYRDEVKDDTLHNVFLNPVWTKYRDAHRAAITPAEDEIKFATEFFDKEHRKRLDAAGGEAKLREQLKALEERLARTDLSEKEQEKLEGEHRVLRHKLMSPGRSFAEFMLNNWKLQKHLYDEFEGGRILWQQAGMEAFDATRTCMESFEKQGEFKITDAKLRAKLYEYWTRENHPGLFTDKEVIRKEFLEPEWIAPAAAKAPSKAEEPTKVTTDVGASNAIPEKAVAIAPNGEIVGRLVDAATGKPVEGATIACGAVINDSLKGGGANAVTDAEGRYRLPVPSPGIYNVWLKKFDKDRTMTAAADDGILVEAGKVATSQLLLAKGRKVVGKVVDEDGKPFANINVHCNSTAWPQSAKTKDDGTFEFVLPPGRAYLYVYESVTQTKDNPFGLARQADAHVIVSATEDVAPIKLTLRTQVSKFGDPKWLSRSTPGTQIVSHEHAADVTGTVVDVSGKPISGAKVFREDGPIHISDDKGEFKLSIDKGTQFVMHGFAPGYHVWFGTPTAGDVLKIVMEKKEVSGDRARQAKDEAQPVGTTERVRIVFLNDIEMRGEQAGTVVSLKAAGTKVKKGDTVAVVRYATATKPEEMIAPIDGEVVKVFVREREQIKPSQALVRIVQFDRVVVEGELDLAGRTPRELIGKVEVVQIEQDTFTIQGNVTFIDPQADANGNHRIRVEVENRQKDGKWLLVPGRLTKLTILKGDDRRIRTEREALGTFRGVVAIEGVRPNLPPLDLRNQRFTIPGLRELPDESLLIGTKGGIANVVVYLLKAPPNWIPTPPPAEPLLIECINGRFKPRASILRVGQKLKLKNSITVNVNFRSNPVRGVPFNMLGPAKGELEADTRSTQSERMPYRVANDIHPWMQSWIMALDHPFAAITDSEGRFEIAGLPPGDYEFRIWHEFQGGVFLEEKLPVRVTSGQVTELALKYGYDLEGSETSKLIPADKATPLMKLRADRLKANDPEAAKKLVGLWKVTMKRGDVFGAEFTQTEDGCLKVKARSFAGTYAVNGNRVELLEGQWDRTDVAWELQSEGSLKLIVYGNEVKGTALGTVLERPKPGEVIPNLPVPSFTEARAERLKANDREAAKKLVGLWKLTFPAGFQSEGEFTQTEDGCLKFEKGRIFHGTYLVKGNRVELVDEESLNRPAKTDHIDFVWEVQADGSLKLIVDKNDNWARYLGAVLERVPADAPKNDADVQADAKNVNEKVGSGLVPGQFTGAGQVIRIGPD